MTTVENPKSLYRQVRETIDKFEPVNVAGEFSQPSMIYAGNLPLFRVEELRAIALFPVNPIAIQDAATMETLTNQLRARLPKEGFNEQKHFDRPSAGIMWLGSLKYSEEIGTAKRVITYQLEISDPDFVLTNPDFELRTEHTKEHPVIRLVHLHLFPTQAIAELFVKYNQDRDHYQFDPNVADLNHALYEKVMADASAGRSLEQYLKPKTA